MNFKRFGALGGGIWVGIRLWRKICSAFGPEGLRLVGCLVSVIFFLPLVIPTVRNTGSLAFTLLFQVPSDFSQKNALASLPQTLSLQGGTIQEGTSTPSLLPSTFASIARDYVDAIVHHAQTGNHPPLEIAYFLIVWLVLGQFLAFCFTPHNKGDNSNRFELIAEYIRTKKNGLAIFLLLGFGLYLSLASIAGITELSEEPPTNSAVIDPKRLDKELAEIQLTEERLTHFYPLNILDAPPTPVQLLITTDAGTAGQPAKPPAPAASKPEILASYDRAEPALAFQAAPAPPSPPNRMGVQALIAEREKLRTIWNELRQRVLLEQQDARTLAYTVFEVDSFPKPGFRERAEHFIGIKRWYQGRSEQLDSALKECKSFIFAADKVWQQWALDIVAVSYASPQDSKHHAAFANVLELAPRRCTVSSKLSEIPARNDPGSRLGPISLIASWIIKSESVPLALIVGMMGFGLLGSVVSSFIRNQGVHQGHSLHVPDLVGIVLRGFSAAIVVFLAVQGGISIFFANQEKANLNPYVVLLACLVASVYSEDAWRVARRRLSPDMGKPVQPPDQQPPADHKGGESKK